MNVSRVGVLKAWRLHLPRTWMIWVALRRVLVTLAAVGLTETEFPGFAPVAVCRTSFRAASASAWLLPEPWWWSRKVLVLDEPTQCFGCHHPASSVAIATKAAA
jgi:hypothetical protein